MKDTPQNRVVCDTRAAARHFNSTPHTDLLTNVIAEKDHKEGCDQVVDALHVAAGRSPDGPNVQDPFKTVLTQFLLEEGHTGVHARNVNVDLGGRGREKGNVCIRIYTLV